MIHAGRHRYVAAGAKIHASVFERMELVPYYKLPTFRRATNAYLPANARRSSSIPIRSLNVLAKSRPFRYL